MSTRSFQPGDSYGIGFTIKNATGALADADSTPSGSVYRNGTADGSVSVTVTSSATGIYQATCTIPSGYAVGDRVSVLIAATVGGVATGEFVDHLRLVGWPNTGVTLDLSSTLATPRALDAVADADMQVNDALWCAVAAAAGKQAIVSTSYTIETPFTGTTIRTFTLDSSSSPTARS